LRQTQFGQEPREAGLAVDGGIILEGRQRNRRQRFKPPRDFGQQVALFMGRKQNVESFPGEQVQQKCKVALGIAGQTGTPMETPDKAGEASDAKGIRVADLYMVPTQPERCDYLTRREARALR
jgi:hypothetical protein